MKSFEGIFGNKRAEPEDGYALGLLDMGFAIVVVDPHQDDWVAYYEDCSFRTAKIDVLKSLIQMAADDWGVEPLDLGQAIETGLL